MKGQSNFSMMENPMPQYKADQSPHSGSKVKSVWCYTSTPQ